MEFHEYVDAYTSIKRDYQIYAKAHPETAPLRERLKTAQEFYGDSEYAKHLIDQQTASGQDIGASLIIDHMFEKVYFQQNRPYYRIFRDYVEMFAQTNLSLPLRLLKTPFPCFSVHFQHNVLRRGLVAVQSFMFGSSDGGALYRAMFPKLPESEHSDVVKTAKDGCYFHMSIQYTSDVVDAERSESNFVRTLSGRLMTSSKDIEEGITFERMVEQCRVPGFNAIGDYKDPTPEGDMEKMIDACWRIAISVCFLATGGDRLIEPDILNKDFRSYLDAVNANRVEEIARLHAKATKKRDGRIGYTIGRSDHILGRRAYDVDHTATKDAGGRPLKYRHTRQAHFHLYWTGAGRKEAKINFVRMLVIRPDLPPAPEIRPKFRTPVDKGEQALMSGGLVVEATKEDCVPENPAPEATADPTANS